MITQWLVLPSNSSHKNPNWQEPPPPSPGGEYSQKKLVGECGPLAKTFTLFMTKSAGFSLPYLWPDQKFDTLFMTVAADAVALNINFEELLFLVLSIMMKK